MMGTVVWILILAMICTDIALLCAIHRYDRAYDKLYSDFIDVMEAVKLQAVSEKEFHKELQDFNTNIKAWYDCVNKFKDICVKKGWINDTDSK